IERHATLTAGAWATAGATPQEATLSEGAAELLGLAVGDRITLVSRLRLGQEVEVLVTGIWRPDPEDAYWLDPELELTGSVRRGSFTTVGPFAIPADDFATREFGERLSFEWRALPDPKGFQIDDIATVRVAAEQLDERLLASVGARAQIRVVTGLPSILATVDRAALVSRTGVLLLVVQFAVLAAYAIILVAGMLADRRRAETALIRSRGGSSGHLAAMALLEATFLTVLAAIVAPAISLVVVRLVGASGPLASSGIVDSLSISRDALVVDAITAVVCIFALVLPMIGGGPNLAGVRAAISRQAGRTLAQRLGLDLALVAVAAIALWQLRLYGAPLTRNARGVLGVGPLLVAAPGIGLLAGAVIATRLIPRAAEIGQRVLERGRGLVAPMGGRGLARRPLRYTRS
ncbi:MAG: FtsX-like permease family protein, partial [Chloroflexota bacterium]